MIDKYTSVVGNWSPCGFRFVDSTGSMNAHPCFIQQLERTGLSGNSHYMVKLKNNISSMEPIHQCSIHVCING